MTSNSRPFGGMTWSIKDSLLRYVSNSQGDVTLTNEIESNQGSFSWPLSVGSGEEQDGSLRLQFAGSVVLQAHHGIFRVGFSDLSLYIEDDLLFLSSSGIPDGPFLAGGYRKKSLDSGTALIAEAPHLLDSGVEAFGGNYAAGTIFDPLITVFNEADWLSQVTSRTSA